MNAFDKRTRSAPHHHTTVAHGFVTGMLSGMARRGMDRRALLARFDIDLAESARRIPVDRYAALYNAVVETLDDEAFGLFRLPMRRGSFEFLCRAALGAPTLVVGLERACRFLDLVLPDMQVRIARGPAFAQLSLSERHPLADAPDDPGRVFTFEWLLRLVHGVASWLAGRGLALDTVTFPYAPPPHVNDYALVYTADARFDAAVLTATLRDHLLDLPIRRDEAALQAFLDGAPGKISMLYRRDRDWVLRVRDLLRAALPDTLTVEAVAAQLHLSPRTLHRRLADEGTGFRVIKDAIRRDIALARLAKTDQPVAALAAELGYADPSAFYRACVAWTGLSPDRYRRQLQPAGDAAGHPDGGTDR